LAILGLGGGIADARGGGQIRFLRTRERD
jgi:hypothetical protein